MSSTPRNRRLLAYAREMRKNMTPEEGKLWCFYLRHHPTHRFRRQEIIGPYIADFYCAAARLIIEIDGTQHFNEEALWRVQAKRPLNVQYGMDQAVMIIDLNPGITEGILRHQLATPGVKGIVLKTYGAGNAPTEAWFTEAIKDAIDRGIVILNVTQCVNGGVHDRRYMSGNQLASTGVISGHDITSEAAITKMMYLFGLGLSTSEVRRYLECSLCGEVSI